MDIETARAAGQLAGQIDAVTKLIAEIDTAISEQWVLSSVWVRAPNDGRERAVSDLNVVPVFVGGGNADNSALALKTARETYQAQLDALNEKLAAL